MLLCALLCFHLAQAASERVANRDAVVRSVEAAVANGELVAATAILDEALRKEPKAYYYAMRGGIRGTVGNLEEALADLDQAIALDPHLAVAYIDRGTACTLLGRLEEAIEALNTAVRLAPADAKAWAARGSAQLSCSAWDAAVSDATRALHLNAKNVQALCTRAEAKLQMGAWSAALADLDAAIELQPRSATALTSRAQVLRRMGEFDRALADADRAVRADGNSAAAYTERATIRGARGDIERAIGDCTTALLIDAGHDDALIVRAILLVQKTDFSRAREDFETVIHNGGPARLRAARHLAWLLAACPDDTIRDGPRALRLARESVKEQGDTNPEALDALAAAHAENGNFLDAIAAAEKAVAASASDNGPEAAARRERLENYRNLKAHRLPGLRVNPEEDVLANAHSSMQRGDYARARDLLEEALHARLSAPLAFARALAWLLATSPDDAVRNGARALELAREAVEKRGDNAASALDALAAARAETGDFPGAIEAAETALDAGDDPHEAAARYERLDLYRVGKPYRLPPP